MTHEGLRELQARNTQLRAEIDEMLHAIQENDLENARLIESVEAAVREVRAIAEQMAALAWPVPASQMN